jgi:flavin-dependent dehydrogenase
MSPNAGIIAAAVHDPWDVVVIGAGPAGTIAARQLAIEGLCVLLVEKARLPRDKVCGGCLGGVALDLLEAMGLGELPARCGGVPLQTMQLASGYSTATFPVGRRIALSRRTFDDALVRAAVDAGVTVCDDAAAHLDPATNAESRSISLQHRGTTVTVQARAVVVATGLAAAPADCTTRTSPRSRIGLGAVMEGCPDNFPVGTLRMACGAAGYVGITAVEDGRVDIAAAIDPATLAAAKSPGQLLGGLLREAGLPPMHTLEAAHWRGTPLLTRRTTPLAAHRCLIIGDAASYAEPFTGEGIGWAMQSAVLASSLLGNALHHWDSETERRWAKLYAQHISRNQRCCFLLSRMLRSAAVRKLAVRTLQWAPRLGKPVIRRLDEPATPFLMNARMITHGR